MSSLILCSLQSMSGKANDWSTVCGEGQKNIRGEESSACHAQSSRRSGHFTDRTEKALYH